MAANPQDIRNVVLVGHGGAGKTSLAEAFLHAAKVSGRLGSVDDGSSTLDHSDIEKQRKHSVDPSAALLEHGGVTMNLIDTPGYPDLVGGAICALAGADTAIVVISASAGIEINTRRLFKVAQDRGLAVAVVVNRIDADNVNLADLLGQIEGTFGQACKPMNLPADGGRSVIDCFANDSGSADVGDVADAHTQLIENIVESDEAMMEAYLGGEEIPADKLQTAVASAMVEGAVIPVLFTSAKGEIGVTELMDAIVKYFPSPADAAMTAVTSSPDDDDEEIDVSADASKPFVGQAFKIAIDPFIGKLAWVRILQGTVTPNTTYALGDGKKTSKIGHPFKVMGKETSEVKQAVAGDIIALAKVEEIQTGMILHAEAKVMFRTMPPLPTPMFSMAVTPKSRGDEQKISSVLAKLAEEDPTFKVTRDSQTNEMVISGMGDLHLRIELAKMKDRFDLDVDTKPPRIPYHETITINAEGHYRHKKQTGGAGQFGEVFLRVEPLERGGGFEFVNDLYGESIPRQYLPAIEKGVVEVLAKGAIAGYPLHDVKVSVYDGKHHPVDSKEVAFRTAGRNAFIDAVNKAKPVLLEPIVTMEITIPANNMGDIASDLSSRRGRVLGQEMMPGNMCLVKAQAPLAEVMQYDSQLRSATGGQGSFAMELSHYEAVPGNVQQQIVAAANKDKQEEKD